MDWCLQHPADHGAVACAMAFMLGMRASEVTDRLVREDVVELGRCWTSPAKTDAGVRTLRIPAKPSPVAEAAIAADELSRATASSGTPTDTGCFARWSGAARPPGSLQLTPHGLKGTHAKLSREVGMSGVLLAAAMGHESETTTTEHYAGRGAVAQADVDRVAQTP